ncbi:MAG: hypothetical protein U0R80_03940 [Nocardioidaceae bacterium]
MAQQTRILAGALMGALIIIGIALWVVLSATEDLTVVPPLWLLGTQVAAGLAVHFFTEAAGYRTPAIAPGTPRDQAETQGRIAFQSAMVRRFAFSEVIAIASVAAAFVVTDGGFLGYVSGACVSLALMIVHVWPWARPVGRTAASLDRDGGRSHLLEAFGFSGPDGGAIQRL